MGNKIAYEKLLELQNENIKLLTTKNEFHEVKLNSEKPINQIQFKWMCKCGNEFTRNISTLRKNKSGLCLECTKKIKAEKRKLDDSEYIKILNEKCVELVGDIPKTTEDRFLVRCGCGNVFETTYASMRNTKSIDKKLKCKNCRIEERSILHMKDFSEVLKRAKNVGITVVSKESDYNGANTILEIVGKCGHDTTINNRTLFKDGSHLLCKKCTIDLVSGENNYNWKGGYEDEKIRFRKTYEFKQWVKDVYKRDNYICQCCNEKSGKLNAHHLDGYNWCVEKRTDVDNGITLCESCHTQFHSSYGFGNNTKEQFKEHLMKINHETNTYEINLN